MVLGVLVAAGGVGWVVNNDRSPATLVQESASYQPVCNGEKMHPGDECMEFNSKGGDSSSYEEMVAAHSPQSLSRQYAGRQRVGWWIALAGVALALLAGLNMALDARKRNRRTANA